MRLHVNRFLHAFAAGLVAVAVGSCDTPINAPAACKTLCTSLAKCDATFYDVYNDNVDCLADCTDKQSSTQVTCWSGCTPDPDCAAFDACRTTCGCSGTDITKSETTCEAAVDGCATSWSLTTAGVASTKKSYCSDASAAVSGNCCGSKAFGTYATCASSAACDTKAWQACMDALTTALQKC